VRRGDGRRHAVAGGCSQADWTTSCINEQRSVGVLFDTSQREIQKWCVGSRNSSRAGILG
jgi:hypothetical protein